MLITARFPRTSRFRGRREAGGEVEGFSGISVRVDSMKTPRGAWGGITEDIGLEGPGSPRQVEAGHKKAGGELRLFNFSFGPREDRVI
jgi:hypothetical protein